LKKYKKLDYNSDDYSDFSISDLKKCADYWLRQFLIKDKQYIFCPIKKRNFSVDNIQVAHFIDRGIMSTRYDLDNCNLISGSSNMFDAQIPAEGYKSKHHKDYEEFLGDEKVKQLKEKSKILKIFTRQDYIDTIEKFKNG